MKHLNGLVMTVVLVGALAASSLAVGRVETPDAVAPTPMDEMLTFQQELSELTPSGSESQVSGRLIPMPISR